MRWQMVQLHYLHWSHLKKYNRIIVDWNVDEDSDIIIISKKTEESLKIRNGGLEIFKKIIGYNY